MAGEELISIEVSGLPVYAVLHRTEAPAAAAVVLLGGWSGTRVGPHGILVAAARRLAEAGFPALRFDYRGRGDSAGAQAAAHLGTMAEDAVAAAEWTRQNTGARRVVLLGICAGAQVAMAAAPELSDLAGLALWSPPPFHPDPPGSDRDAEMQVLPNVEAERRPGHGAGNPAERRCRVPGVRRSKVLGQYWKKLFDARTWEKLARGGLQPGVILKILTGKPVRAGSEVPSLAEEDRWAGARPDERRYELALRGVDAPALFIYGAADPEQQEARAYYAMLRQDWMDRTTFELVEGANHSFYSLEWKEDVIQRTLRWLKVICCESCS